MTLKYKLQKISTGKVLFNIQQLTVKQSSLKNQKCTLTQIHKCFSILSVCSICELVQLFTHSHIELLRYLYKNPSISALFSKQALTKIIHCNQVRQNTNKYHILS